ncbi:MAG: 7-cyano-7-deazaguanine synthase QueC [Alphaproteobacteria bacterium]|nr:MAG: 7-cyano-7-deazaguanine synthase QueC [Alphaproteobacteria bacterium]
MSDRPAILLLSGGLDSATVGAIARDEGYALHALSFRYGQRHMIELEAAVRIARHLGIADHRIVEIDLGAFGGSALTDDSIAVPKGRDADQMAGDIPTTYVPARNTIFLSYALALGEVIGARDIFIGVNAVDFSGYPDCRPDYVGAFEAMANLATRAGREEPGAIRIRTPLIAMTKAEIIRAGNALGLDYGLTVSCYDPDEKGRACGECDACILRREGFAAAGLLDPTRYREAAS